MAITIKHKFQSLKSDGVDSTFIQPSNWNDTLDFKMATARLLGRTTAGSGDVEEVTPSGNFALSAGGLDLGSAVAFPGTGALKVPVGTTAQRPGVPAVGMLRYNTTNNTFEKYEGASPGWKELWALPTDVSVAGILTVTGEVVFNSTGSVKVPVGTTAQRPGSPATGMVRVNSDTGVLEVYVGGAWAAVSVNPVTVPMRQTVLSGPVDASGLPNFWPTTSGSLTLTMQGVTTTPLVVAIAKGHGPLGAVDAVVNKVTNDAIVLPASQTNWIYVDAAAGALGSTTLVPIYQYGGTISIVNGQHTFDIAAMQMYVGNGAAAVAVNRVFIGEAVTGGSTVTSTVCYAYRGYYDSGLLTITAAGTEVTFSHNLGLRPDSLDGRLVNISTELGHSAGWETNLWSSGSGSQGAYYSVKSRLSASVVFATLVVINISTQLIATYTAAKWKLRVIAQRGW